MSDSYHICPENDLREHVTDDGCLCPCLPVRHWEELNVWVHNSYDGREVREVLERALAMLGCALTEHHHHWSPSLRQVYEIATALLQMHMPNHVGYDKLRDEDREACKSEPQE